MSGEITIATSKDNDPIAQGNIIVDENFQNIGYVGAVSIDRRYVPAVLHYIAKDIVRKEKTVKNVHAVLTAAKLKLHNISDPEVVKDYLYSSVHRLSRLRNCGLENYLALITLGQTDQSPCNLHVLKYDNPQSKAEFLKSLKTRVLGFHRTSVQDDVRRTSSINLTPPKPTHRRGVSSGAILLSPGSVDAVFRDSVYYIGKVTISQPQAPPKFIDDVLIQLQKIQSNEATNRPRRRGSRTSLHEEEMSYDDSSVIEIRSNDDLKVEKRTRSQSFSSDTRESKEKQELLRLSNEIENDAVDGILTDEALTLTNIQQEVQSRLVTLSVSKTSLMLFSVGSKTLLLEKKIKNISFCTKGEARSDHFGFICRENGSHICYIFQGESEFKVDAIMKAMKLAFTEALEASAHLALCDTCPLQYLHKLSIKLESISSLSEKDEIIQDTVNLFSEYDQLHIMNTVNDEAPINDEERVYITVEVLRKFLDERQKIHRHSHKIQSQVSDSGERDRSKSSTIFEKAKKSLTSSFQNLSIKKGRSKTFTPSLYDYNCTELPINGKLPNPNVARLKNGESIGKPRSRSYDTPSSCPTTPEFTKRLEFSFDSGKGSTKSSRSSSLEEIEKSVPEKIIETKNEEEPEEVKCSNEVRKEKVIRKGSWRQAIYHSVVDPSRKSSVSSIATITHEIEEDPTAHLDKHQIARERWKSAIMNQILLIRMEKENKKLAANISATELRRQKLCYLEICTYSAESASMWDDLLSRRANEKVDDQILLNVVRGGVPRMRRGEIWQYLIKQYTIRIPEKPEEDYWKNTSYRTLLKKNTVHQHAILIDLGRTFPTHAHFIPRLGSGQLSLFNILKAYSLLDKEVGYCQGLSFVAGLLLMHMSEEDAFKSFCHVMFDLQIRNQYKPDMNAVQQQLYQLSRLLHDYHPKLYEHLNANDVTPTLYAAPWFLTLYASQYPIGFVSRVMDLVLLQGLEVIFKVALVLVGNHADEILECDSFESIVEYMKTNLPEKVLNETDEICSRALNMDIKQQLNLYEVEYQLLKEEMIDIRQNKERLEKQEVAHKELESEVIELRSELKQAKEMIQSLKLSIEEANIQKKQYEINFDQIKVERDMLKSALLKGYSEIDGFQEKNNSEKHLLTKSGGSIDEKSWELVPNSNTVSIEMDGQSTRDEGFEIETEKLDEVNGNITEVATDKPNNSLEVSLEYVVEVENNEELQADASL